MATITIELSDKDMQRLEELQANYWHSSPPENLNTTILAALYNAHQNLKLKGYLHPQPTTIDVYGFAQNGEPGAFLVTSAEDKSLTVYLKQYKSVKDFVLNNQDEPGDPPMYVQIPPELGKQAAWVEEFEGEKYYYAVSGLCAFPYVNNI